MIYVNGLNQIDENVQNISTAATVSNVKADNVAAASFGKILEVEEARLDTAADKKAYTLDDIYTEAARKYDIPKELLTAIGYHESRFNPNVTSSSGAMGIMQLMPETAKSLGVNNAYDPYENIMGAAKLLNNLSELYNGDLSLMIAAYNAGCGNVAKYNGIPPFSGVQNYVAKVKSTMAEGVSLPGGTYVEGNSSYAVAKAYTSKNTAATTTAGTASTEYVADSFYTSSRLDELFSYEDYQTFMKYFDEMLDIISSIGTDDDSSDDSEDDSLTDLFRLDMEQRLRQATDRVKSVNDVDTTDSVINSSIGQAAAAYAAAANLGL